MWILIITVVTSHGVSISSIDFNSEESAKKARLILDEEYHKKDFFREWSLVCVKKE